MLWDSMPMTPEGVRIAMSEQAIFLLKEYASVPCWHLCIVGPIPLGATDPILMQFDYLVRETREEATEHALDIVHAQCVASSYIYNRDDWEVLHCMARNTC